RLVYAAHEDVPHTIRNLLRAELAAAVNAIAEVLDDIAKEFKVEIPLGVDLPPPPSRVKAVAETDKLSARVIEVRPLYIRTASPAEVENFASFTDSLTSLTGYVERLLDEPPLTPVKAVKPRPILTLSPDPELIAHSFKVGLCAVVGYSIGLCAQRADLS